MNHQYKIYIIGKVTGLDYSETQKKFSQVEEDIIKAGHLAVNPMRIVPKNTGWTIAMKMLLPHLADCDAVYLLPDWKKSLGGQLEYFIANALQYRLITRQMLDEMLADVEKINNNISY